MEHVSISAIVGQHNNCPRPHRDTSSSTTLALYERCHRRGAFVMNDSAHFRIVESYLEAAGCNHQIRISVESGSLRTTTARAKRSVEVVAYGAAQFPQL